MSNNCNLPSPLDRETGGERSYCIQEMMLPVEEDWDLGCCEDSPHHTRYGNVVSLETRRFGSPLWSLDYRLLYCTIHGISAAGHSPYIMEEAKRNKGLRLFLIITDHSTVLRTSWRKTCPKGNYLPHSSSSCFSFTPSKSHFVGTWFAERR